MKENRYNLEKLIKVSIVDKEKSTWYEYRKAVKFLGIQLSPEGFYCTVLGTAKNIDKSMFLIIDNVLYEKAECILFFENDHRKTFYFDTYEEAKAKADEFTKDKQYLIS
jgi:hypothetical protein